MLDSTVVFNELMYHPANDAGPEWIELYNQMSMDMDLSSWHLANGIDYTFPEGTILGGGEYLVVASDPVAVAASTGLTKVLGPFSGRLSNNGETIELRDVNQRVMDELDYEDDGDWPIAADGSDASLAKRQPLQGSGDAGNWTHSGRLGGTPGVVNFSNTQPVRTNLSLVTPNSPALVRVPDGPEIDGVWMSPRYLEGMAGETWRFGQASIGFRAEQDQASYQVVVQEDQPLAYYRMSELTAAGPAQNAGLLGVAAQGTYLATATVAQPSLLGEASDRSLHVSAADSAAAISVVGFEKYAPNQNVGGGGISIEFWIRVEDYPTSLSSLVSDGEAALDFGTMVYLTPEGKLRTFQRTTSTTNFGVTTIESQLSLPRNEATHVVTSWEQSSGQMRIFLNGQEVTTQLVDGVLPTTGDPRNTNNGLFIGKDQRNAGSFSFTIDELAVYNKALPASRVARHFDAGRDLFSNLIATDLRASMYQISPGAFMRVAFDWNAAIVPDELALKIRYDDGYVAYLNGVEVARNNVALGAVPFDRAASVDRSLEQSLAIETVDLTAYLNLLKPGGNLLAVHGLNSNASDTTFLQQVELTTAGYPVQVGDAPAVVIHELQAGGVDGAQIELWNASDSPIALNTLSLVRDGATRDQVTLPNQVIAPRDYVTFTSGQLGFTLQVGDRLFLTAPAQQRVVDAQIVSNRVQGLVRDGEFAGRWLFPSAASFGSANPFQWSQQIVINEIMYHAAPRYASGQVAFQESDEEWIELFHRGSQAIDLSGWKLNDGIRFDFPAGTVMQPGSYLVIARDLEAMRAKYPELASILLGGYEGSLSNSSDAIELLDGNGNPADYVRYYDGGRWPEFADAGGASLELVNAYANNASPESWEASEEASRSEWQTVTYRGIARQPTGANYPTTFQEFSFGLLQAGEILIDDVHVIEDPAGTALELIQNSTFTGGYDRWRPVGNHQGSIVSDPLDAANDVFHLVASGPEEHLQNHVETTLKNGGAIKRIVSGREYEISFRAKWLAGSPQLNTRLFFNYLPQTTILTIPSRSGTPGRINSRTIANSGPTFENLRHEPVTPQAGDPVVVSVRATDDDGVQTLQLVYSVDDGPASSVVMSRANDGVYRGSIPPQAVGRTVQFFVRGTDTKGAVSDFPARGEESRALYRVGPRSLSTTGLQNLQILLTPSDEAWLNERTHWMSNRLLRATVIYEEQAYYNVGVRLKGSEHGRPDPSRRGYYLKFSPEQLFRGVHESIAIDRSGGWRFGRTFGQEEILIYQFMNRAGGVPSQYNDLMFVDGPTVPAGTAMIQMARYGDIYLDSQYENGSDGMAYEYELIYAMQGSQGAESEKFAQEGPAVNGINLGTDLGDDKESYRHYFLIENNRDRDDYQPLIQMTRALRQRNEAFTEATNRLLDVDQWMRAYAALTLSGADDNYAAGAQHNAIFYQRPSDGKMLFLPFDMDFAFIKPTNAPLSQNADLTRFRSDPNNDHAFLGHLLDIMNGSFNRSYMERWVNHVDELLPGQDLNSLTTWIEGREAFVRRSLPAAVAFAITSEDQTISTPTAQIQGQGWVDVRSLYLEGSEQPLPVRWRTNTSWEVDLPLVAGRHELKIEARGFDGRVIGGDTLTVVSNYVSPQPGDLNGDGQPNAADIDLFCEQWLSGALTPSLDLNGDQTVSLADHQWLIAVALQTTYGDANFDRRFDSQDLVLVFQAGEYEDAVAVNSQWSEGDWNCDGEFSSSDLVLAFQSGSYTSAAQVAATDEWLALIGAGTDDLDG